MRRIGQALRSIRDSLPAFRKPAAPAAKPDLLSGTRRRLPGRPRYTKRPIWMVKADNRRRSKAARKARRRNRVR